MKGLWMFLASIILASCSITIRSLPEQTVNRPHHAQRYKTHAKAKAKINLVDSNWIENYKAEEQKHAYTIPADADIKPIDGKFIVPQAVLDHYSDMTHAKSTP